MIDMTPAARERLDDYLLRLRTALRGASAEVAEDVEQNVREHIEISLGDAQAPVSETVMIGILDRLGPPEQWLGDDERPAAQAAVPAQTSSRLPYISFALVIASIVLIPMFGFLLLIPAMFVSRAWIDQMRERDEPLGSRRWLVYPAIALVLLFVTFLMLIIPPQVVIASTRGTDLRSLFDFPATPAGQSRFLAGFRGVLFGSWWIVAAGLCAMLVRPIRFVFAPLLDGLQRKHFAALAALGALAAAAGAVLLYLGGSS